MENASNALIISGTILIALIILGMGVYLMMTHAAIGESYNEKQISTQIANYNNKFLAFSNRDNITMQEIISLKKFASQYSQKNGIAETAIYVGGTKLEGTITNGTLPADYGIGEIKGNSPDTGVSTATFKYYKCDEGDITYDATGMVSQIKFKKNLVTKPD